MVVNEAPLNSILTNPEATGRVALWGIELSPLDILYEKRHAIKSQVLSDFLVHWMELQLPDTPDMTKSWRMHFDGSKREAGAGSRVILTSPQGDKMKYVLRMKFQASNNESEYEALIHDMRMAKICGATRLVIYGDSNLIVQQTMNECHAHAKNMIAYRALYNTLEGEFDGCELRHIERESNEEDDRLANIGSTCAKVPPGVFLKQICVPSIKRKFPKGSPEESEHSGATLPEGHEGPEKLDT